MLEGEWRTKYENSTDKFVPITSGDDKELYSWIQGKKQPNRSEIDLGMLSDLKEYEISSIELVVNPNQMRMFHGSIEQVEMREKEPQFQPKFQVETNSDERTKLLEKVSHRSDL